jgi:hypothetical protein
MKPRYAFLGYILASLRILRMTWARTVIKLSQSSVSRTQLDLANSENCDTRTSGYGKPTRQGGHGTDRQQRPRAERPSTAALYLVGPSAVATATKDASRLVQRWRCLGKIHLSIGLADDAADVRDRGAKRLAGLGDGDVLRDNLGPTLADATHRLKVHLDYDEFVEQCAEPRGSDPTTWSLIASTFHNRTLWIVCRDTSVRDARNGCGRQTPRLLFASPR